MLNKCWFLSTLFLLNIFVVSIGHANSQPSNTLPKCTLKFNTLSNNITLKNVPIARTNAEMNIGLSQRKHAPNGMLFSWQTAEPRVFWMKDTWVDLSIGFFDANDVLFDIQTMQANTLQYHYSVQKTKTALELPQGKFKKIGLVVGSKLAKQDCH